MAGNEYGPRGEITNEEATNRLIETKIKECLSEKFPKFKTFTCLSENHSTYKPGNFSSRKMLPTRDIAVGIGNSNDTRHIIKYNTATKSYVYTSPKWHTPLSPSQQDDAIECITNNISSTGGKRSKTYRKRKGGKSGMRKTNKRKNKHT